MYKDYIINLCIYIKEKFEDTKGIIRNCKSKMDRRCNE